MVHRIERRKSSLDAHAAHIETGFRTFLRFCDAFDTPERRITNAGGRPVKQDVLSLFHPVIQDWFRSRFKQPTEPQIHGWPHIAAGENTLIAAPTGSGKTLTAFLAIIDRILRANLTAGGVRENSAGRGSDGDGIQVVYVSPLRALSNDMHRNLETPLQEIRVLAEEIGLTLPPIRVGLRTGDTPSHRRTAITKNPPQILVTTPESLYLMLTSERSRNVLRSVKTVIVDEIHALVRDKRGSHLALSLERLETLVATSRARQRDADAQRSRSGQGSLFDAESLCDPPSRSWTTDRLQRIGLSATQKPIERMAEFLIGVRSPVARPSARESCAAAARAGESSPNVQQPDPTAIDCRIVDVGHARDLDLAIEVPPSELSAVCSHEQWAEINARLVELINAHRSTLIFVNTRRLAERVTFQLTHLLGEDAVGSHHGSLSKEIRLDTEQKLKQGALKAVVATSSLELGIDVGYIDLVVQLGSPRSIAAFLQRIGRSGHALGLVPKGRLFALTRDELMECMGLIRAVKHGRLDVTPIPEAPLDILAQQIVAELAAQEWNVNELYEHLTCAWPYRALTRETFNEILRMLGEGLTPTSGRKFSLIYYDRIQQRAKGRNHARLTAVNNGGAIGEIDSVRVVLEEEHVVVGSVDEDFAIESSAGDIFLLGNSSWRIHGLRGNDLLVSDAHGAPPTIPFWRGEAPGRTLELSEEVSRLREDLERKLIEAEQQPEPSPPDVEAIENSHVGETKEQNDAQPDADPRLGPLANWLCEASNCTLAAASQIVTYVAAQRAAVGFVPTQKRILFERFFDESGGMQLVVHAPFGGRINRAWGLAFRKRFCRSFDFELQATADDDGFILSLGPQHSFPIESLFPFMRTDNARNLLEQAMLIAPMFHLRWRWNVTRALFVARMRNGKKVPPALQRFRSEDLLTAVFPKLTGCQEEHMGDHEIPDHPLMRQTVEDCLFEALDIEGLLGQLRRYEAGELSYVGRDTREPSPFAYELLNANPYAFLDGGEIQERRARAVATRRSVTVESVRDLGRLDPGAIASVVDEAQPFIRHEDELHDVLLTRFFVPTCLELPADQSEGGPARAGRAPMLLDADAFAAELETLHRTGRALPVTIGSAISGWAATECWTALQAALPDARTHETVELPDELQTEWTSVEALNALLRGWVETSGPVTAIELAELLGIGAPRVFAGLEALEGEGLVLRGRFLNAAPELASDSKSIEWCHRGLLARIHRRTISGLRREIEPVDVSIFLEFLHRHQGAVMGYRKQGVDGVHEVVSQLQGIDFSARAWEESILPLRVEKYDPKWLDELCLTGDIGWARLIPAPLKKSNGRALSSITKVVPVAIYLREDLPWLIARRPEKPEQQLSGAARDVIQLLEQQGALFANDLLNQTGLLPTHLSDTLGELVSAGLLTADGFAGLRRLIKSDSSEEQSRTRSRRTRVRKPATGIGRWNIWRGDVDAPARDDVLEEWAWQLIRRWGVVFRELVVREPLAPKWWELSRVFRRLEARGELRGGRFVKGVGGEQFAMSDTVRQLRELRNKEETERQHLVVISGQTL